MLASGFTNAPVSKLFLFGLVASSIAASLTDSKHFFYIHVVPHLWPYKQLWRLAIWQSAYTNSTSLLFAAMTIYNMRVIERLWGSRKFASFLVALYPLTSFLPPFLLALAFRPISLTLVNTLPAGPTPLIFALLAQYHSTIPTIYKWRLVTGNTNTSATGEGIPQTGSGRSSADAGSTNESSDSLTSILTFSDKTTTYLLGMQLAFSQLPGSLLTALVGYGLGIAYRNGVLPERLVEWRLPGWIVGGSGMVGRRDGENFEGLRRRLEGEGRASGIEATQAGDIRAR